MKSHLRDSLKIIRSIYLDAVRICTADVSMRDLKTIRSRVKDEGISFLTITLPDFARDFERSLECGQIDPTSFRNFRKNGLIPAFLQGITGRVFDKDTGRINDDKNTYSPDLAARSVACVRQICLAFKKIELPCSPEREHAALENFIATEQSFEMFTLSGEERERFSLVSSVLWGNVLRDIRLDNLPFRHGPGATSEKLSGNRKYAWKFWHERLEPYLPFIDNCFSANCRDAFTESKELEGVSFLSEDLELPVRVTPVPKTLKGPRIIAIEPSCMQFAQQGLRHALYSMIESHRLTRYHVNFRDQSINQKLAMKASIDRRLVTVDLKDASDRVPLDLALSMFDFNEDLKAFIDACRSRYALMPDGRIVGPLHKFASMGSALCFPIEAMYFYTLCVDALLRIHDLPVTSRNVFNVSRDVFVYGDDLILPRKHAVTIIDNLTKYNCKVNHNKSFIHGYFRESCGVDAYRGVQVTPVYLGTKLPDNRRQVHELISSLATANFFYKRGYFLSAEVLFERIESILGPLPTVSEESHVLGRIGSRNPDYIPLKRWKSGVQHLMIKCWTPGPVRYTDELDGYAALSKSLFRLNSKRAHQRGFYAGSIESIEDYVSRLVSIDPDHLKRSARHGDVALFRRWVPAYLAEKRG